MATEETREDAHPRRPLTARLRLRRSTTLPGLRPRRSSTDSSTASPAVSSHRPPNDPPAPRPRRSSAALGLSRLGDVPVVVMLAWAGWLAVPWSFSGLAQARAAAAAAAANTEPPRLHASTATTDADPPRLHSAATDAEPSHLRPRATATDAESPRLHPPAAATAHHPALAEPSRAAWGVPAVHKSPFGTIRPGQPSAVPRDDNARLLPSRPDDASTQADMVALERARIAGEVHDVAGHGLAAIAMQAGIALVVLDEDPEQARASLQAIRQTSTTALAQLRAALDGIDPPDGDLTALIDGVRAAGLPVDVEPATLTEPTARTVPDHLRETVYRVVRESLTNVLRHAGPTRALVRATGDGQEFVLEVADRGAGHTDATEGRGLAGMRARVTEAGGHLTTGAREGGGFQVIARFPQVRT
ncbi:histidine kinase [Nonomuraea fuscirosea]|uniref:histidine kinase n=1 Tax=Nonomuraea fuscirosea TaxID=1291556 RepID=A0A2T0MYD3_9ACTN|nr:histidine kinase [Nonomuraea fuscirosea]